MYQGKRLMVTPKQRIGYRPKRLAKPGKRLLNDSRQQFDAKRMARCTAAAAALCTLAFTGAVDLSTAYLHDQARVDNAFVMGSVTPWIDETFDKENKVKKDVRIQNKGNAPVYIRALWLISWKDAVSGSILPSTPVEGAEKDYTFTGPETGWLKGGDGYYYYTQPVQPGMFTAKLIQTLTDQNTDPTRQLCVDVITQAVQASPAQAVGEVFRGVNIGADGSTLIPPPQEGGETP